MKIRPIKKALKINNAMQTVATIEAISIICVGYFSIKLSMFSSMF